MKTFVRLAVCITFLSSCADDPTPQRNVYWRQIGLGTNTNLQTVFFVNSSIGFVGGSQRAPLSTVVNRFINDDYWTYVEGVHINTDSTKYVYNTFSANNPEPTLFKTTDGGNTWTGLATPFVSSITDIFFLDELFGYVATEYEGIHKTTDGGHTWKSVLSNIAFLGNQNILQNPFNKIYFLDKTEGFAFNQYKNIVVKTIDGGASWTIVPFFNPTYINATGLQKMSFPFDKLTGYGIRGHRLVKTVDGGLTWDTLHYTLPTFIMDLGYVSAITDLSFLDENTAFMTYGGNPYVSRDGAVNWERIDFRPLSGHRIQPINENEFYLLSYDNLHIAYVNISNQEYFSMTPGRSHAQGKDWFFADGKGFVIGPNGLLLKYEGSGR